MITIVILFCFSSRRRHTRWPRDWSSDVCSSDLLLAAPLGFIGVYIRQKLEDSPVFQEMSQEDEAIKAPVWALFRDHWRALVRATAAVLLNAVGFYVILTDRKSVV